MGLTATAKGGTDFEPVAEGMHDAICYAVIDIGTQFSEMFSSFSHKIMIGWELPNDRIDMEKDGEQRNLPRVVSNQYSLSLHEKSGLRKDLISWRGRNFTHEEEAGFDISKLLSVNCQLQIIHKEKKKGGVFAKVNMVLPPKTGKPAKVETENDLIYYSIEDHGKIIPDTVYPWVRDMIENSEEFKETMTIAERAKKIAQDPPLSVYEGNIPDDEEEIPF